MDTVSHASSGALTGAAIAELMMPSEAAVFMVVGLSAGLLPDIDFLAEFQGKVAAWTKHRIVAHNIPAALLLTSVLSLLVWWLSSLPLHIIFLCCLSATSIHLLLDVLTSFGTCLFYPFKKIRFSTRSHFIFDPVVILISCIGLYSNSYVLWLIVLITYLLIGVLIRQLLWYWFSKNLAISIQNDRIHLEPRFLAPFRWMIIIENDDQYTYAYQTLFWRSRWYKQKCRVSGGYRRTFLESVIGVCQNNELLRAVLVTFDMPVYTLVKEHGELYILVEDLKWRLEPNLRPLAFTAKVRNDSSHPLVLDNVKQGSFLQSGHKGLFKSASAMSASLQ